MYKIRVTLSQDNTSETIVNEPSISSLSDFISHLEKTKESSIQILNAQVQQDKQKMKTKSEQPLDNEEDMIGEDIDDADLDQAAVRVATADALEPDLKKQRI